MRASAGVFLLVVLVAASRADAAQTLPEGPIRSPDGTLLVAGEIVGTIGAPDDEAFFNYTDYEHNALRMMRLSLAGPVAADRSDRVRGGNALRGSAERRRRMRRTCGSGRGGRTRSTSRRAGSLRRSARTDGAPTTPTILSSAIPWPIST